jgi:hypothetical protein
MLVRSRKMEKLIVYREDREFEVVIYPEENRGWFEHNEMGDILSGELLFDNSGELEDFDGCCVLPEEVADSIVELGFVCNKEYFCE